MVENIVEQIIRIIQVQTSFRGRKFALVRVRFAVPATRLVIDDVAASQPTAQRALAITVLTLLLAHLAVLLAGELIAEQLQQVLRA